MLLFCRNHISYPLFKEFLTIEDAVSWGKLNFGDWLPEEQSSVLCKGNNPYADNLKVYLGYGHKAINNQLRGYFHLQRMSLDEESSLRRLQSANDLEVLIRTQVIPDNIVLYRAINDIYFLNCMRINSEEKLRTGSILKDNGFMSTSLVYESLKKECDYKILLRLLCPEGTPGAYVDLISHRVNEQEVLLPPNTIFKVLKIYKNKDRKIVFDCLIVCDLCKDSSYMLRSLRVY